MQDGARDAHGIPRLGQAVHRARVRRSSCSSGRRTGSLSLAVAGAEVVVGHRA